MTTKQNGYESELHLFGKMVFESAEGQTIELPPSPHPRFTPPGQFAIQRVEMEKGIPWAGYNGRKPDIILTDPDGRKLIVEITNASAKSANYCGDMERAGFWLAVELDVRAWKGHVEKRPDFSSGSMLQDIARQFKWLAPGRPAQLMEWEEYRMAYEVYDKDAWLAWGRESMEVNLASYGRAEYMDWWSCKMIPRGVSSPWAAAVQSPECPKACLALGPQLTMTAGTYNQPGPSNAGWPFYIGQEVETGWVLHRDGVPLLKYRVRSMPGGCYQGAWSGVYSEPNIFGPPFFDDKWDQVLETGDTSLFRFEGERVEHRVWPIRPRWKQAVEDIFADLVPGARPTY